MELYRVRALCGVAATMLMAGCATTNNLSLPVEERSTTLSTQAAQPQRGSIPVTDNRVVVTPMEVKPTIISSTPVVEDSTAAAVEQAKAEVLPPPAPEVAVAPQKPATVALLASASDQAKAGRLRAAQTSLQRAQRISPKDPEVYISLAEVHRQLGEFVQAEQVALKGVAIAAGQSAKLRKLWTKIGQIRREAGDLEGADSADINAARYR